MTAYANEWPAAIFVSCATAALCIVAFTLLHSDINSASGRKIQDTNLGHAFCHGLISAAADVECRRDCGCR